MNETWTQHLHDLGASFEDGRVVGYGTNADDPSALEAGPVLCDLSHFGLLLASGEDAGTFLHGQFSSDVKALAEGQAQWSSWSTAKGRMLTSLLLWHGKQGYFLQLPNALLPGVHKRLQMFVLRAKVKLDNVSDTWVRLGLASEDPAALERVLESAFALPALDALAPMQSVHCEVGRVLRLSARRFEVVTSPANAAAAHATLARHARPVGAGVWELAGIRDGVVTVLSETQEAFVLQMANLDLTGGVSFKKGCYPGQEIVARTQYRGILKKRMVRVAGKTDAAGIPLPGTSVYASEFGDQSAGEIANVAAAPGGGFEALVVAQLASINNESLRLGSLDGPELTRLPLPYTVPEVTPA